jgi:hypothetical protein
MTLGGLVAHETEGWRGVYRGLVGKHKVKRPLERPRHRWEDNIKMDLKKIGWGCINWIDLAQNVDRWWVLLKPVMNILAPQKAKNFLTS